MFFAAAVFAASLIPVFAVAFYAVPQVDDFYYSIKTHYAVSEASGFFAVLGSAAEQVVKTYNDWQGTWAAVFLFSLQPGIYGEKYYCISTFILVLTLIGATFCFTETILGHVLKIGKNQRRIFTFIILFAQIQLVPSPLQSFYWWNGACYYTFFYSLSLILFSLVAFYMTCNSKKQRLFSFICTLPIAAVISGGNYVTALVTLELLFVLFIQCLHKKDKRAAALLAIIAVFAAGFAISITAPGNAIREARYLAGQSAFEAIGKSFLYAFWQVYRSTDIAFIACMLLISPLLLVSAQGSDFKFKHPIIFALVTFCLFTSQFTPPLYGMGDMNDAGSARIVNIIYFSYYWLVAANVYYIGGYIIRKHNVSVQSAMLKHSRPNISKKAYLLLAVFALIMTFTFDGEIYNGWKLTTPNAVQSLILEEPQNFFGQWKERFDMLNDASSADLVFKPISYTPKLLYYGDLTDDSEYEWSNLPIKLYYGKTSVITDWSQ